jgi:hypothetical protein
MDKMRKSFIKRFEWICDFYKDWFNCILNSLNLNFLKGKAEISEDDITLITKEVIKTQFNFLKEKLNFGEKNEVIKWLNYLYSMEKQVWLAQGSSKVICVGNPILVFYCLEISATILLGKNPEKEYLSHRQVRKNLKNELEKLEWDKLIFPFCLRKLKDRWEPHFTLNEVKKYRCIESSYWGRRGREFIEMYKHWEKKDKNKKVTIKEIKSDFFVYFYDLFYKYSESFRYRPVIPVFKKTKEFNFYTQTMFSIILAFFEALFAIKFPEEMLSLLENNLQYKENYLPFQVKRWEILTERIKEKKEKL